MNFKKFIIISGLLSLILLNSRHIDAQTAWNSVYNGGGSAYVNDIVFINSKTGFAAGGTPSSGFILKTTNRGNNWQTVHTNTGGGYQSIFFVNYLTGYSPVASGSGSYIVKTTNGGSTWNNYYVGNGSSHFSVNFVNALTGFIAGEWGSLRKTIDGGITWTACNSNTNNYLWSVFFVNTLTGFVCGEQGMILKTVDGGNQWTTTNILGNPLYSIKFLNSNTGYAAGNFGLIYKTTNGGSEWINKYGNSGIKINELKIVNDNVIYAVCDSGYYLKTTNKGTTWVQKSIGVSNNLGGVYFFNSRFGFIGTSNNQIFKSSDSLHYHLCGYVNYSDNGASVASACVKSIKLIYPGLLIQTNDSVNVFPDGSYVLSLPKLDSVYIRPHPNSSETVDNFIPGYYPSSIRWENASKIVMNRDYDSINISVQRYFLQTINNSISGTVMKFLNGSASYLDNSTVYVYSNNQYKGYFITGDNGFYLINNLTSGIYKIFVNRPGFKSDSIFFDFSNGGNVSNINFTLYPAYTGVINIGTAVPDAFRLFQNYPNPFNNTTIIDYKIKSSSNVTVKVYDIKGSEVSTLVNEFHQPGIYRLNWNVTDLSSGIYYIRLTSGIFNETKKAILLK